MLSRTQTATHRTNSEVPVVSWGDSQAIQIDYAPPPPTVAGISVRPDRMTSHGKTIYYPSNAEWYEFMHRRLTKLAAIALKTHEAAKVLSNMSLGWDTALAEAASALSIPLVVMLPFHGVQAQWSLYHKQRFSRLLSKASEVITLYQGGYKPWKLIEAQNKTLLDSNLILALWDGNDEHVKELVALAHKNELEVINLWKSWRRYGGLMLK